MPEEMLTVADVSKLLNISDRTVRNWIEDGLLIGYKFGNSYRIELKDYETFKTQSKVKNTENKEN